MCGRESDGESVCVGERVGERVVWEGECVWEGESV